MDVGHAPEYCIELHKLLPEAEFFGADDLSVTHCCRDSRQVQPGDLFVALAGTNHDGHQFIGEAVARGAAAVVAQQPVALSGTPVVIVPDTAEAYGRICQALAGDPSRNLKVIGITGTNGKTTTSCLLASILATAGHKVGLLGTLAYFDGEESVDATLTTPPADELAHWLARMVAHGCSHAVMEVSSHALAQSRVAGISFDAACVTNVRRDHLDYHPSVLGYRLTKSKLFRHLAGEGFAVINADDPTSAGYLPQIDGPVLTVGVRNAAEITATIIEQHRSQQVFLLTAGSETVAVQTDMIGLHHVYNCLVAAAVGLAYGIDLLRVARGLEAVKSLPGRLERIECGQPYGVFVDFAHTPDALAACLATLREVSGGRLICVFGAGGDRDQGKRPLMGQAVQEGADLAIITTDNPRSEDPQAIAAQVASGFSDPSEAVLIADRAEAISFALAEARPGDCVLIAGKGHEHHQIVGNQSLPFDDAEIARQWLYQFQPDAASAGSPH
jgi:UDP-N-acetylmuramoyl-L-alanyl-D-glutamate--2,6-diaminopimelate ligase